MSTNTQTLKDNSYSVDRINPNKGYTKDNIWIISHKANTSKNNATLEEYENLVQNFENYKLKLHKPIMNRNINIIYNGAKYRSKKLHIDFDLDIDYLLSIYPITNKCPLLNIMMIPSNHIISDCSPSLDRMNPKKGYVKGNVWFISHKANRIKSNLTLREMKTLLKNWKRKLGR